MIFKILLSVQMCTKHDALAHLGPKPVEVVTIHPMTLSDKTPRYRPPRETTKPKVSAVAGERSEQEPRTQSSKHTIREHEKSVESIVTAAAVVGVCRRRREAEA